MIYWAIPENSHTKPWTAFWNSEDKVGFFELEIRRHQGITHFGNSEGKGRLNYGSCPWYGIDIFWNPPFHPTSFPGFSPTRPME